MGGGITGLAAAWELQQHGVPYVLLEASGHLGGKLVTLRTGQFVIEAGPDSFL
ncbi:MAG: FAD-dependent oxidoreductase, partial [Chloroflexi bacterium]|nr:FAD-dependent oxidoreductase [Chloroflexota bacterium]